MISVTVQTATGGAYLLTDCMVVGHVLHGLLDSGAEHVVNLDDESITVTQNK